MAPTRSTDPVELAFLDAYAAGVFVAASAGNDGPGASTANHLSPWVTTVAASTQTREFASDADADRRRWRHLHRQRRLDHRRCGSAAGRAGLGRAVQPHAVRRPGARRHVHGKIVACERGGNGRVEKGYNVKQGGAAGMVLYNPTLQDAETDNHWLPTVHLADGTEFTAFMAGHTGVTAPVHRRARSATAQGDVMAAFSSRGPAGNFIKPDVTAPGVQILAGQHPDARTASTGGPPGEYFQAIAGTSMSSPHVAGAAILLKAAHPTWTPGQIKSALMTTAITDVRQGGRDDAGRPVRHGRRPDRHRQVEPRSAELRRDRGRLCARWARPGRRGAPQPAVDQRPGDAGPADHDPHRQERDRHDGRPSRSSATAPAARRSASRPSTFTLAPGESVDIKITIKTRSRIGAQYFGADHARRRPSNGAADDAPAGRVDPKQGTVTLTQSCAGDSVRRGRSTTCDVVATNNSFETQTVDLTRGDQRSCAIIERTGATRSTPSSRADAQRRAGRRASRACRRSTPGVAPAGYLPLDLFGITPTADRRRGDHQLQRAGVRVTTARRTPRSASTPTATWSSAAATAEDNNCCDLPPDPGPGARRTTSWRRSGPTWTAPARRASWSAC